MLQIKKNLLLKCSLWIYLVILLSPLLALYLLQKESGTFDLALYKLARNNTLFLALSVFSLTTFLGGFFSYLHCFYKFRFKKIFHALLMMPLALPAYVLAFIYLGLFGPSSDFSLIGMPEIQGEFWFLVTVLSLALTPYTYFFSNIGLSLVSQSEVETELMMGGGWLRFFLYNTLPKMLPFLMSAQILVIFESVSDFGAASVINVPVMTTMIYKLWFDLFSFSGAVHLSLRYSGIILLILFFELLIKRQFVQGSSMNRDPVRRTSLPLPAKIFGLGLMSLYIFMAFLLPAIQILLWSMESINSDHIKETLLSGFKTLSLAFSVGVVVVSSSLLLQLFLKKQGENSGLWMIFSTIGYSIPGSILAVSAYAILLFLFSEVSSSLLLVGLVFALGYKFLTVGMRPIASRVEVLPKDLIETSQILRATIIKRMRDFIYPYLRESCVVGLLLVMIEVMKEMPLTLMLAPSDFQTLSIKIFNYTSEGEWEKAALPSLMLLLVGIISVSIINSKRTEQ